jgi:hypothetical protein
MYFADHAPPHFHARYAEHKALVTIENGIVIAGALPRRAQSFVREWLEIHREELFANWARAQKLTRRTVQPA